VFDADHSGLSPSLSMAQPELSDMLEYLSGVPDIDEYEVLWYVMALDGVDSTASMFEAAAPRGRRLLVRHAYLSKHAVVPVFAAGDSLCAVAGENICFTLHALDDRGRPAADWHDLGRDVILRVDGSTAETDTSTASWNEQPDGYTWLKLTAAGKALEAIGENRYAISHADFVDGRLPVCIASSKAESGIHIAVEPDKEGWVQESPGLSWTPREEHHLWLDLTWPSVSPPAVYLKRPFELVIALRDRYQNPLETETAVRIIVRFSDEIKTLVDSVEVDLDTIALISGERSLLLMPTVARTPDSQGVVEQRIYITHATNPRIGSRKLTYYVLHHPPAPFGLMHPRDNRSWNIGLGDYDRLLEWRRPDPVDPYNDIPISRSTSLRVSDDIRYRVYFIDAKDSSSGLSYLSDDEGRQPQLSMSLQRTWELYSRIKGSSDYVGEPALLWYVEATDGLYVTRSDIPESGLRGHRVFLYTSRCSLPPEGDGGVEGLALEGNFPNPFSTTTQIGFRLPASGAVTLKVYNVLGELVSTVHDGMLERGAYTLPFNAAALPSGLYHCRLEAGGVTLLRSMVLMR
jgi:hypothetical protein